MIVVKDVHKQYEVVVKQPGVWGALKALIRRKTEVKHAVSQLNFSIQPGELVGYIGANGAGKSTTIKLLTGILTPTSGEVEVCGINPHKRRVENARRIAAVFGQRTQLLWDIAVRESYQLLKHIYEIPEQQFQQRLAWFSEVLDLEPLLSIPVRQLSLGQKMRCELAAAFLHQPEIVYLDEPTIGLDVAIKVKIRAFIKEMNQRFGTTVILTSHDMQDIEEICNRLMIIDHGTMIYDGTLQAIKEQFGDKREIHFEIEEDGASFVIPEVLQDLVNVEVSDEQTNLVTLAFSQHQVRASDVIAAMMEQYKVRDLTIADAKIETIVQEIYRREEMRHAQVL
jgi:ABC-2 type transport system ATP-binding protein